MLLIFEKEETPIKKYPEEQETRRTYYKEEGKNKRWKEKKIYKMTNNIIYDGGENEKTTSTTAIKRYFVIIKGKMLLQWNPNLQLFSGIRWNIVMVDEYNWIIWLSLPIWHHIQNSSWKIAKRFMPKRIRVPKKANSDLIKISDLSFSIPLAYIYPPPRNF